MLLNSHIIADRLENITAVSIHSEPTEASLIGCINWSKESILDSDYIYVAESEEIEGLPIHKGHYTMILIGDPPSFLVEDHNCDLICCACVERSILIQTVYKIFREYAVWEQALVDVIAKEESLNKMCRISQPIFRNEVFFILNNERISSNNKEMDILLDLPSDRKSFESKLPQYYEDNGTQCVYQNIYKEDRFLARAAVFGEDGFSEASIYPLMILSMYVGNYLNYFRIFFSDSQRRLKEELYIFLFESLAKQDERSDTLEEALREHTWNINDQYLCATIRNRDFEQVDSWQYYIENDLKDYYRNSVILFHGDELVLISNLTKSTYTTKQLYDSLIGFANKYTLQIGLSNECENIYHLVDALAQSQTAIQTGAVIEQHQYVYRFSDILFEQILLYGVKSMSANAIIPDELKKLVRYDRNKGTELFNTLNVLCHNQYMYIAKAIDELHIHRSTFKYRIDKINKILDVDLTDIKTLFLYQFLMEAIDKGYLKLE